MEAAVDEKVLEVCPTGLKRLGIMCQIKKLPVHNMKTRTLRLRKSKRKTKSVISTWHNRKAKIVSCRLMLMISKVGKRGGCLAVFLAVRLLRIRARRRLWTTPLVSLRAPAAHHHLNVPSKRINS